MFTLFQHLPTELRLKIWALAANQEPRTLDIATEFCRCEQGWTTFYNQKYDIPIADVSPPALLQVSREARNEALKHYTLEFKSVYPGSGVTQTFEAKFYVNYASDIFVPVGNWNSISFWDFMGRSDRMRHLAIDVTGSFWKDNVKENIAINEWVFEGVQEIILFESKGLPKTNHLGHYAKLETDQRELMFVETEKTGKLLDDAKELLATYLGRTDGIITELHNHSIEQYPKAHANEDAMELEENKVPIGVIGRHSYESRPRQLKAGNRFGQESVEVKISIMELVQEVSTVS